MTSARISAQQAGRRQTRHPGAARWCDRMLAGLFALLLSGIAVADGTPQGQFAVWAIGLPNGYIVMEHQALAVQVTADDVARGVVDVQSGTRFVINTTEPSGVAVDFRSSGRLFRAVQIDGMGSGIEFGPAGATVVEKQIAAGRRVVTVDYRFTLAPDTVPGTYAWPIAAVVRRTFALDATDPRRTRGLATAGVDRQLPAFAFGATSGVRSCLLPCSPRDPGKRQTLTPTDP